MWGDVLSGTVAGLTTAGLWALLVFGYQWWFDNKTVKRLQRLLAPESFYVLASNVGLSIKNPTGQSIVVRSVIVQAGPQCTYRLKFSDSEPKDSAEVHPAGWATLPPYTRGIWQMPPVRPGVGPRFPDPTDVVVTVEYKSLFGETKLIEISPIDPRVKWMLLDGFKSFVSGDFFKPGATFPRSEPPK
ncbi:MAG: hypothetical protein WD894_04965 [Pirellulales bacterium]